MKFRGREGKGLVDDHIEFVIEEVGGLIMKKIARISQFCIPIKGNGTFKVPEKI